MVMKELSTEEKAKAYEEAIERARKIHNEQKAQPFDVMLKVFPTLKESEDEKIRKAIIQFFELQDDNTTYSFISKKDILAWLEKQGEQVQWPYVEPTSKEDKLHLMLDEQKTFDYENTNIHQNDFAPKSAMEAIKEDKVDNANKVEPKFKVKEGKWYVCISQFCNCIEGRVYKATSDSRIMDDFGTEYDIHSDAYKYFRLWTIKDAKDGDVLVSTWEGCSYIYIFKEIENNIIISHIFYYPKLDEISEGVINIDNTPTIPATKEQRDTLMKAMADARYTFDFEKKELKKIEKKEELTEFEEIVEQIADTSVLNAYGVKELAKRLLSNAKKQLQEEFDKQLEQAYKNADEVQYGRGYRKAVEDARKWVAWWVFNDEEAIKSFNSEMRQKLKELSQGQKC